MNARHTLAVTMVSAFVALGFSGPRWLSSSAPTAHALPYYADKTLTPRWPGSAIEANGLHRVGDFHLVASNGRAVSGADVAGHVYVASFFYTECRTLCPDLRVQLTRVHEAFAGDTSVMILSHSVMPERDDPARLTGSRAELMRLARNAYFVELADTTGNTRGRLRHTETLVLVDRRGHIRGLYDGSLAYDVTQLIADITQLKKS
jgi:protein SCO1/2